MRRFLALALLSLAATSASAASISINNLSDQTVHVKYLWVKPYGVTIPQQTNIDARERVHGMGEGFPDYVSVQLQEVAIDGKPLQCHGDVPLFKSLPSIELFIFSNGDCEANAGN